MGSLGNKAIMARNIKRYMDMADKTRYEVCDALDIKYTTFADWLNAKTYPRIDKIEMMAKYFGITKADLVEDPSDKRPDLPPEVTAAAAHLDYKKPGAIEAYLAQIKLLAALYGNEDDDKQ